MAKKQTTTDALAKLVEEAKAASHQRREAEAEARDAHAEVAHRRDAARETHASGGDVDAAIKAYHQAERTLDEARIKMEGLALKAERARATVDGFMQEHHLALLEDLEPGATKAMANKLDLATQLVVVEAELSAIRSEAARYISASGHSPHGNVPIPDALSELMGVVQDIASGLRPIASPLPHWEHRNATEQHFRIQAEEAERREQEQRDRAKDRAAA